MDGVVKDEYGKPVRVGYPEEFQRLIAEEGGDAIKMKKIQPEIDASYSDHISKGNSSLESKDYEKALEHFSSALELKPLEKEPAEKIEKIKIVLNSLEELHKNQFSN